MLRHRVLSSAALIFSLAACSQTGSRTSTQIGGTAPHAEVPQVAPMTPPKIVQLWISRDTFGAGDQVTGQVTTSSNVASVEARVGGFGMPMHRSEFGRFVLSYTVPALPSFVKRTFDLRIIARNAHGDVEEASVPIHVK